MIHLYSSSYFFHTDFSEQLSCLVSASIQSTNDACLAVVVDDKNHEKNFGVTSMKMRRRCSTSTKKKGKEEDDEWDDGEEDDDAGSWY